MNHPTSSSTFNGTRIDSRGMAQSRVRVGRGADHNKETKIKLNKNGTTIESIHITCACGEEIVVNCRYSENSIES